MTLLHPTRDSRTHGLRRAFAALCIFLVLLVGVTHLVHSHPGFADNEAGCSLCQVAHLSALPAGVATLPLVAEHLRPVPVAEPVHGPARHLSGSIYIRPPPALNPHA